MKTYGRKEKSGTKPIFTNKRAYCIIFMIVDNYISGYGDIEWNIA